MTEVPDYLAQGRAEVERVTSARWTFFTFWRKWAANYRRRRQRRRAMKHRKYYDDVNDVERRDPMLIG